MATQKMSSFHLETIVVELTALEEIATHLMKHVSQSLDASKQATFAANCDRYIKEGELQLLVETFIGALEVCTATSPVDFTRERFSILFSLVRHLPSEVLAVVVPRITSAVLNTPNSVGDPGAVASMRVKTLHNLYTVVGAKTPSRYQTLLALLKFSIANKDFTVLDGSSAADIEDLVFSWRGSSENSQWRAGAEGDEETNSQKRTLLSQFCDLMEIKLSTLPAEDKRINELKEHRFLVHLLESLDSGTISQETLGQYAKYAARAAVLSVKYPLPGDMAVASTVEQEALEGLDRAAAAALVAENMQNVDSSKLTATASSIFILAPVKHLANVPQHANLYNLLKIFAGGDFEDFLKFEKENPGVLEQLSLDTAKCTENMRLLSLASLCAEAEVISYKEIADGLQVEDSQVEKWIIKGITSRLIDAKIDQLSQTILIKRGSQRLLTEQDWAKLQKKLVGWKSSVQNLLETIQNVHTEQQMLHQQG